MRKERISHAAYLVLNGDHDIIVGIKPPARHPSVLLALAGYGIEKKEKFAGFVTTRDRFVHRVEAMTIAKAANQLIPDPDRDPQRLELYTEDLW